MLQGSGAQRRGGLSSSGVAEGGAGSRGRAKSRPGGRPQPPRTPRDGELAGRKRGWGGSLQGAGDARERTGYRGRGGRVGAAAGRSPGLPTTLT